MTGPLVLGIDASTTACKAVVWDAAGALVAEGRRPLALANPSPDAYEQDAEEIFAATLAATREAVAACGRATDIRALCVTHQRETFVLADERGRPLAPAVVWMDSRCRADVGRARADLGDAVLHEVSGKPPCTTPSFYKLLHSLRLNPELRARSPRVLDVHAFLVLRLTGELATSLASADPTGLVDMRARAWATSLVEYAGLDARALPRLVEPGQVIGALTPDAAASCGLAAGLPVVAGAGDGQAAGLGAGIVAPGRAYLNLGTALVSGVLSRDYRTDLAFRTLYGAVPGTYFLETDLKGGTFTVSWLVEKWLGARTPEDAARRIAELETEASELPPGSGGLVVVPYWNGVMNPYWDDDASGIVAGLRGDHGPAHLYRAILEGLALEQRLHTTQVEAATGDRIAELVIMGGGARSALFRQIVTDVLAKPVVTARTIEATALGAGMLAAVGAGVHASPADAAAAMARDGERTEPGPASAYYADLYGRVYAGLYPALRAPLSQLAELRAGPR